MDHSSDNPSGTSPSSFPARRDQTRGRPRAANLRARTVSVPDHAKIFCGDCRYAATAFLGECWKTNPSATTAATPSATGSAATKR